MRWSTCRLVVVNSFFFSPSPLLLLKTATSKWKNSVFLEREEKKKKSMPRVETIPYIFIILRWNSISRMLRVCAARYCQPSGTGEIYTHNSRLSSFDIQYFTITIWWSLTGRVYDVESDFSWHVEGWLPGGGNGVSELHILEQYKGNKKKNVYNRRRGDEENVKI